MHVRFTNVLPIRPGYDGPPIRIRYSDAFYTAEALGTGRLVAQFRPSIEGEVLFEADTNDGSITRDEGVIEISIPAEASGGFSGLPVAFFDIVRIGGDGRRRVVPGQWSWPVKMPVTRDVE